MSGRHSTIATCSALTGSGARGSTVRMQQYEGLACGLGQRAEVLKAQEGGQGGVARDGGRAEAEGEGPAQTLVAGCNALGGHDHASASEPRTAKASTHTPLSIRS